MTDVAQTSIDSYRAFDPETLGRAQRRVLMIIERNGPMTNKQIAEKAGVPINSVTPRVRELRELRLVFPAGLHYDPETKRQENLWKVKGAR